MTEQPNNINGLIRQFIQSKPIFRGLGELIDQDFRYYLKNIYEPVNNLRIQFASPKSFGRKSWTVHHGEGWEYFIPRGYIPNIVHRMVFGLISRTPPNFTNIKLQVSDRIEEQELLWHYSVEYGYTTFFTTFYKTRDYEIFEMKVDYLSSGVDYIEPIGLIFGPHWLLGENVEVVIDGPTNEAGTPKPLPENPIAKVLQESKKSGPEGNIKIRAIVEALTKKDKGEEMSDSQG